MHPIQSADVTADLKAMLSVTSSLRDMALRVHIASNERKFANAGVYRRRAELMRLLHPEERKGKEPALGHLKSGATVVITMESATSSIFLLP